MTIMMTVEIYIKPDSREAKDEISNLLEDAGIQFELETAIEDIIAKFLDRRETTVGVNIPG